MRIYMNQTDDNCLEARSQKIGRIVSFMNVQLKEEHKEDYMNMGETKVGIGLLDS